MAEAPLEADTYERDSAYGEEISTYSASLTTSSYDFPSAHGRRYHAYRSGRYFLPNDDQESERLDIHYALIRKIMGGALYHAPLPETGVLRAIDLATGTGLWAIDFADLHSDTEVLANDLSPTQPTMVPPNLKFLVDDIEEEWGYEHQPFDFIHACFLVGAIKDWPRLIRQAYNCAKPGGWVEFQDWDINLYSQDGTVTKESPMRKFQDLVITSRESAGYLTNPGPELEKWMKDAGFVDVSATKYLVPFGPWPRDKALKEVGFLNYVQLDQSLEAIAMALLTNGPKPWTPEEVQVFLVDVRKDMMDRKVHAMNEL
jgi:SAM-dependent methyltransferase